MEPAPDPALRQRVTAIGGIVALVIGVPVAIGVFGAAVLGWVLAAAGAAIVALGVGVLVRRNVARRFPETIFTPDDISAPAREIDDAAVRLAPGGYAAFIISPVSDLPTDASAQIWIHAGKRGGVEKTTIELNYDSASDPSDDPALVSLLGTGWQITKWEPNEWVLLEHEGRVASPSSIELAIAAVSDLDHSGPTTEWTFRAFA